MQFNFNEEKHEYTVDGKHIPGVNELLSELGIGNDFTNIPTAEEARMVGTYTHDAISYFFKGTLDEDSVTGKVKTKFQGFKKFYNDFNPQEIIIEKPMHYDGLFGGKPDAVFKINGKIILVDWKCGQIYPKDHLATAAYCLLCEREGIIPEERWVIRLMDNDYKPIVLVNLELDKRVFLDCVNIYHYKLQKGMVKNAK